MFFFNDDTVAQRIFLFEELFDDDVPLPDKIEGSFQIASGLPRVPLFPFYTILNPVSQPHVDNRQHDAFAFHALHELSSSGCHNAAA